MAIIKSPHYGIKKKYSKLDYKYTIKPEDFEKIVGQKISLNLSKFIRKLNLKYRHLALNEEKTHQKEINKILNSKIVPSGVKRKKVWETGWNDILNNYKKTRRLNSLLPHYYKKGKTIMRFNKKYILPEINNFEATFLRILQIYIVENFIYKNKNIYEFGCGTGHNLLAMSKILNDKSFYGLDWSRNSQKIIKLINHYNSNKNKNIFIGKNFNFFKINQNYMIKKNSACLTWGGLEQIGKNFRYILNFFLKSNFDIIVNIEPFNEIYQTKSKFDSNGLRYHNKRNYLFNYYKKIKRLEDKKKIKILKFKRIIGSAFHDGWNILVFKKLK